MDNQDPQLREVWSQKLIPVVYRQGRPKPILLRLPYAENNYDWLRDDHQRKPKWDSKFKCWEVPNTWLDDLIRRTLKRFGRVYVIQPYKEQQKCAPACWNATGFECECSCMGENHGSGSPNGKWYVVSETCAVQWGPRKYACRLILSSENKSL